MKQFLIFCGEKYYANGGANDLISTSCKTQEKAIEYAKSIMGKKFSTNFWADDDGTTYDVENFVEWVQVVDLEKCEVIFKEGKPYGDDSGIVII